jgi:hypothetical protein
MTRPAPFTIYTVFVIVALVCCAVLGSAAAAPQRAPRGRPVGANGNMWSAAAVSISGTSAILDTTEARFCSAFGNTSAAATITVQYSADRTNFYSSSVNTGAVTGNFGINWNNGARFIRLISNAAATITANVSCK